MFQKQSGKSAVVVPFKERSTGLNRRSFEHTLGGSLLVAKQASLRVSVLSIRLNADTDCRREPEDAIISELVKAMRERLTLYFRGSTSIGQPWFDGLAVIDVSDGDIFAIHLEASKLVDALERWLQEQKPRAHVRVSLGIAIYPDDGNEPANVLDHAYAAAERAGRWQGSGFCFFSRSVGKRIASGLANEEAVLHSLRSDMVGVRYKPIIDMDRCRLVGANAEPDWHQPEGDPRSIGEVEFEVERSDLIDARNDWAIALIAEQSRRWSNADRQRIGFEVGRSQISSGSLAKRLSTGIRVNNALPNLIDVRFDAKLLLDGTDHRLRAGLQQVADLGVQLTVVNIGAGLLPIEAMMMQPLKTVELTPSMVSTIGRCARSETRLRALIDFMGALGLRTRSVNVTTDEQLEFLKRAGCNEVGGPIIDDSRKAMTLIAKPTSSPIRLGTAKR